jgi:thiol-disulfide isomerase/thioredoxin
MAEVEESHFTSLSQRIAALNQSKSADGAPKHQTFGKRPPPPIPTSSMSRPNIPTRGQTTNNPPVSTYGSSVTKQANNQPLGVKGNLLPPPPVDRDNPRPTSANAITPPLQPRNLPPPLPGRNASQPSPSLPPRKSSTQLARRGSNSSTVSFGSTISGISLSQTVSSTTSASSTDTQRKLPPPLDEANLPPLPPTRRELEEKAKKAYAAKPPLVSAKSFPNVLRDPPVVERDLAPKMPPRPQLPSRPSTKNALPEAAPPQLPRRSNTLADAVPAQPPRKFPPPGGRSILTMGFNNKSAEVKHSTEPRDTYKRTESYERPDAYKNSETPNPSPRPAPTYTKPSRPSVLQLTAGDFDKAVMSGKPALVDFYAPYCKYCKELEPIWKQLGEDFAFASDRLVIAKVDVHDHKSFLSRFEDIKGYPTILYFDGKSETPEVYQQMRELDSLTWFLEDKTGIKAADGAASANSGVPPPIPISSKPTFAQVKAVQSRPAIAPAVPSGCLICRDFSAPDQVASQHPRQSLLRSRNGDMTKYLAELLCEPFSSATDKARAIFTWLHHNIAYDTAAFFGNNVKHVDPKDTINTGLAVCGGYAGLYAAVALKAGLECVMVTGHGKGYGYSALKPGEPIPPCKPEGHAWNCVRIDGGEWKLLDACWGAGNVGNQVYNKKFTPSYFTMSNDDFGIKHFPSDASYFFRSDGRPQTWEKYIVGPVGAEPLQLYGSIDDHGLSSTSFSPPQKRIPVNSDETVRFQFSSACEHWDHQKNGLGKPYCMILKINGVDGRNEDFLAFESNDLWYWLDVPAKDLGAPGQMVSCFAVTTVEGRDARGFSRSQYLAKKGRCAMEFGGVAAWDLV